MAMKKVSVRLNDEEFKKLEMIMKFSKDNSIFSQSDAIRNVIDNFDLTKWQASVKTDTYNHADLIKLIATRKYLCALIADSNTLIEKILNSYDHSLYEYDYKKLVNTQKLLNAELLKGVMNDDK